MGLTRYEQETIVNFNAEEAEATIYTADPVWMRKLLKIVEENPQDFRLVDEAYIKDERISITVEFPKKLVQIRKGSPKFTDEQRAAMSERMKKLRESQLNGGNGYEMQRN